MSVQRSRELIETLVAFDTTSRESNLPLIEFVRDYLARHGVESRLIFDAAGGKANLLASVGPTDRAGIVLSGHTDVVPVDGQAWDSDPFRVRASDARLYGRGTADMKSFIAVALALLPEMLARPLSAPIHFAFSYDEEVGCIGVHGLLESLHELRVAPRVCIVGEPTGMRVVNAHKGKASLRCSLRGKASHSSLTHQGVNAVELAAELIAFLRGMGRRLREEGPQDAAFDPPYTTVHTGLVNGGTALNIVPEACAFEFEIRNLPAQDPQPLLDELMTFSEREIVPQMHAVDPHTGVSWERLPSYPALETREDTEPVRLVKRLSRNNDVAAVSFGTEGGLYQRAGIPAVVCGPGHIAQAHRPNEFIDLEQVRACEEFLLRLLDELRETE